MQGLTVACYGEIVAADNPECQCRGERERERERKLMREEREGVQMLEFDGQNSCDHFEPVLHPATKPSPSPLPRPGSPRCTPTRSMAAGIRILRF